MEELEEWYRLHIFYWGYNYLTKELAEFLSVTPRTIQRWIKGKTKPSEEKLNLIKKYLRKKAAEIST